MIIFFVPCDFINFIESIQRVPWISTCITQCCGMHWVTSQFNWLYTFTWLAKELILEPLWCGAVLLGCVIGQHSIAGSNPHIKKSQNSVTKVAQKTAELCTDWGVYLHINQSNFYSANIPGEARLSGTTIVMYDHSYSLGRCWQIIFCLLLYP